MLTFYYGTELENLADRLFDELENNPPSNLLAEEVFVVQNHGIGQWLSLRMAKKEGIAANLAFEFPSERIWSLIRLLDDDIPQTLPSDRVPMTWTLMGLFEDEQFLDAFENLQHYIEDDDSAQRAMRSWKLASKISDVFDQYLIYRPQMILDWERRKLHTKSLEAEKWQSALWRRMISYWKKNYEGKHLHRAQLQQQLLHAIENGDLPKDKLPERITVFGVSSVSPAFIKTMTKLSKLTGVHFYHLTVNPSIKKTGQFKNPLLQSLGQEGVNFMSLFSDYTTVEGQYIGESNASEQSFFTSIQEDLKNDDYQSDHKLAIPPVDSSMQVHNCHSPMREVEVLYDQLLALLDENPELTPDEILIMTANIETYAPFIEAVFTTPDEGQPEIPYAIADRGVGTKQSVTEAYLNILELSVSRFKVTDVLDLLDSDPIRETFGFTDDELNRIEQWVADNQIRWGIDGKDKKDLDLPESDHFTWRAGLRRILVGYAMHSSNDHLYEDIFAYQEIETSDDADLAGKMSCFLNELFSISNRMDKPRKPEEWSDILHEITNNFLPDNRDYFWELSKIREGINKVKGNADLAGYNRSLPFSVIRRWLGEQLQQQSTGGGRIGRGVTFSSLMPMRNIPFEVIGMIGMNDGAFPRSKIPIEFDLMNLDSQIGDPVQSEQDRYLFLENLLSARKAIYFSYVGQSNRQDTDFPPSVVLREFIDYLEEYYGVRPEDLITKHRLQSFSPTYFKENDYFSYSQTRRKISERLASFNIEHPDFFEDPLPALEEEWKQLSVSDLVSFFQHPSKYLLRNRLGIYLRDEDILTDEREPFELDKLSGYQLKQELLDRFLKEESLKEYQKIMQSRDMLPEGWTGEREFQEKSQEVQAFGKEIQLRLQDQPLDDVEVDIKSNGFRIMGTLGNIYQGAQMDYRFGKAKAKYRTDFWISHILFQLAKPDGHPGHSKYYSWDDGSFKELSLRAFDEAPKILSDLLELYGKGLRKPLKLFCRSSYAFGEAVCQNGKTIEDGIYSAEKEWDPSWDGATAEKDDAYYKLVTEEKDPFDQTFIETAHKMWAPFFKVLAEGEDKMKEMKLLEPFDIELSGINLVEASAGTGKTYNITSLYIRALIEQDIPVGKILVVTYTEAATKELKDRLLGRIRESIAVLKAGKVEKKSDDFLEDLVNEVDNAQKAVAKLENAVRMFDEASVYTIHGFCYRALQEQAFESRAMYDADMIGDDKELVQEAVDDYWRNWVAEVSANPQKKPLLKLLHDRGINPDSLASELKSYIGKPQLKVLPEEIDRDKIENNLNVIWDLYEEIRKVWSNKRNELYNLLNSGDLSYYTPNKLDKWFRLMDEFLSSDLPPFNTFTQFYRFQQSEIDTSLKKKPKEQGVHPPQHDFFNLIDKYDEIKDSVKKFEISFKKELLTFLRKELIQKKEELQVLSYDDLLLRLRNALLDGERGSRLASKLRQKYPMALVDEFQDTDPNQYDIFRTIYKDSDGVLFMIGDPKQSIYGFRGADVYSYIKARSDAPKNNRYKLNRNFRSTPQLLRGLNAFWGQLDDPFAVGDDIKYKKVTWGKNEEDYSKLTEFGNVHPPIRFRRLSKSGQDLLNKGEARKRVAEDTAKEINRLIEGGKKQGILIGEDNVEAKDIAVLVRTHKQADLMSSALQEFGIKSVRHSEQSVFESDEAEHLEQLLKAVAEAGNEMLIKTALSLPLTGYSAEQLFEIEEDDETWTKMLQQFSDWHQMWIDQGFSAMYRSLLTKLNVQEHIITYSDGERRLTNLLHLGELLEEESRNHKDGTRSLLQWLARKRQDTSRNKSDEEQMRLESDQALVKIVTMHKSKGLQYPIVFCPFLWHGPRIENKDTPLEYHDPENPNTTYLDLNGKRDPDRSEKRFYKEKEELAENLRLAYVAMTRAEYCLYLSWESASDSQFSPLGYLLQDNEQAIALLKDKVGFGANGEVEWSSDELHDAIGNLCDRYPSLFTMDTQLLTKSSSKQTDLFDVEDDVSLSSRVFERETPITTGYHVSSFSSLSSWMDEDDPDVPDYDQFMDYSEWEEQSAEQLGEKNMFTFPKGPQPGTCIHNIFENYFSKSGEKDEVITNQLQLNGIDTEWKNTVKEMLDLVIEKPLHKDLEGLSLSAIQNRQIPEMEFYYQNEEIETRELLSIIRNETAGGWENKGRASSGFLKGFIDLTFEYDGKFYLLDYKTNYLGDTSNDYRQELLQYEMQEASYDLQYHIYTVALHRFLKKRLPGYSYDDHFGGAFYLFLRGMNEQGREGIFFDRPQKQVITALDEYIKGEKNG